MNKNADNAYAADNIMTAAQLPPRSLTQAITDVSRQYIVALENEFVYRYGRDAGYDGYIRTLFDQIERAAQEKARRLGERQEKLEHERAQLREKMQAFMATETNKIETALPPANPMVGKILDLEMLEESIVVQVTKHVPRVSMSELMSIKDGILEDIKREAVRGQL